MRVIPYVVALLAVAIAVPAVAQSAPEPAKKPAAPAAKPASKPAAPVDPAMTVPDATPGEADAIGADDGERTESSGLPVPRFVSLRSDPINMRSGPGLRYPVEWVYRRRHLPVEVTAEFDTWRKIRDPDGDEGWVHQSMITGRRTGIVKGTVQPLRRNDGEEGHPVAMLEAGVIVNVLRCPAGLASCRVEVNGLQGWLKRDQFWGVYPTETLE
jgi:SH3-like domain-containing protein